MAGAFRSEKDLMMRNLRIILPALAGVAALLGPTASPAAQSGSGPSILIRGGTVIDGTGAPRLRADVRVEGESIVEVAPGLQPAAGERVIDATGLVVAPG